jgi:hypothetical protein
MMLYPITNKASRGMNVITSTYEVLASIAKDNYRIHELYEKSLGSQSENGLAKDHDKIIKNVLKTVTIDEVKNKNIEFKLY